MADFETLSPLAKEAWKRIASDFPQWTAHLDTRDGELECAIPAPSGSKAGLLIIFTHEDQLWVRFAPSYMCYLVDDEDEMASIVHKLTTDEILFRIVTKGDEWIETTIWNQQEESEAMPDCVVRYVSWSGRHDR